MADRRMLKIRARPRGSSAPPGIQGGRVKPGRPAHCRASRQAQCPAQVPRTGSQHRVSAPGLSAGSPRWVSALGPPQPCLTGGAQELPRLHPTTPGRRRHLDIGRAGLQGTLSRTRSHAWTQASTRTGKQTRGGEQAVRREGRHLTAARSFGALGPDRRCRPTRSGSALRCAGRGGSSTAGRRPPSAGRRWRRGPSPSSTRAGVRSAPRSSWSSGGPSSAPPPP